MWQELKNNASAIYASYASASAAGGGGLASGCATPTGRGDDAYNQGLGPGLGQGPGFDVCLLEMNLPLLDGREVLRRYRNWEEEQQGLPRVDPNRNINMLVLGLSTSFTGSERGRSERVITFITVSISVFVILCCDVVAFPLSSFLD